MFDGCISAYNADDGWDLFAKGETGPIGKVIIRNSVAFKNGWILDGNGKEVNAGNGNGFKMGGQSITGYHTLINSVAFGNKAKGIDSNSCPDIQVYNSISFNNNSYNVAFYTNDAKTTDFFASGIISYKNSGGNTLGENFKFMDGQDEGKVFGENNYYFGKYDSSKSQNSTGVTVDDSWFVHVDMAKAISGGSQGICRNADGSVNMNGFLVLTDQAPKDAGARLENVEQEKAPKLPELPRIDSFTDVSEGDWFYDNVAYAVQNGLMIGVGDKKFNPGGTTTCEMLVTILARLDGVGTAGSSPWYQAGMEWARSNGIIKDTDGDMFRLGQPITREAIAVMLYRCAAHMGFDVTGRGDVSKFSDGAKISDWARTEMEWAVAVKLFKGTDTNTLLPDASADRAQVSALIQRFVELVVK